MNDTEPVKLSEYDEDRNGMKIFRKRCPHLYDDVPDKDLEICCDTNQLTSMEENLARVEGIFKRCSTCFQNLVSSICEFTCAQNKNEFMEVVTNVTDSKLHDYDCIYILNLFSKF